MMSHWLCLYGTGNAHFGAVVKLLTHFIHAMHVVVPDCALVQDISSKHSDNVTDTAAKANTDHSHDHLPAYYHQ